MERLVNAELILSLLLSITGPVVVGIILRRYDRAQKLRDENNRVLEEKTRIREQSILQVNQLLIGIVHANSRLARETAEVINNAECINDEIDEALRYHNEQVAKYQKALEQIAFEKSI